MTASVLDRRVRVRSVPPVKILVSALIIVAAITMTVLQEQVRAAEAWLAGLWLNAVMPGGATSVGTGYLIYDTPDGGVLFRITAECTSLLLIAPLLLFAAALTLHHRTNIHRIFIALAAGIVALTIVNQFRLGLIAWATHVWALDPGYEISHKIVGSIIGIIGFAAALILTVVIVGFRRKDKA